MADRIPELVDVIADELGPCGTLPIGAVAQRLGVTIDALRYYESESLLGEVARDAGGRRRYSRGNIYAVAVVHAMRGANFGIGDIRDLVAIKQAGRSREDLIAAARETLTDFEQRLDARAAAITEARALLARWATELDGDSN